MSRSPLLLTFLVILLSITAGHALNPMQNIYSDRISNDEYELMNTLYGQLYQQSVNSPLMNQLKKKCRGMNSDQNHLRRRSNEQQIDLPKHDPNIQADENDGMFGGDLPPPDIPGDPPNETTREREVAVTEQFTTEHPDNHTEPSGGKMPGSYPSTPKPKTTTKPEVAAGYKYYDTNISTLLNEFLSKFSNSQYSSGAKNTNKVGAYSNEGCSQNTMGVDRMIGGFESLKGGRISGQDLNDPAVRRTFQQRYHPGIIPNSHNRPDSTIYRIKLPPTPYSYVDGIGYISRPLNFSSFASPQAPVFPELNNIPDMALHQNFPSPPHYSNYVMPAPHSQAQTQSSDVSSFLNVNPQLLQMQSQLSKAADRGESFIRAPVDFVSNGRPTGVYQWKPHLQAPIIPQQPANHQQHHFNYNGQPDQQHQQQQYHVSYNRQPDHHQHQQKQHENHIPYLSSIIKLKRGPYIFNGRPQNAYKLNLNERSAIADVY